jgi:cobalt-zinc-cadmium resistance protein CzcA
VTLFSGKFLGTEFLPQLNEGSLWITAEMPMSSSRIFKYSRSSQKDIMSFRK